MNKYFYKFYDSSGKYISCKYIEADCIELADKIADDYIKESKVVEKKLNITYLNIELKTSNNQLSLF